MIKFYWRKPRHKMMLQVVGVRTRFVLYLRGIEINKRWFIGVMTMSGDMKAANSNWKEL